MKLQNRIQTDLCAIMHNIKPKSKEDTVLNVYKQQ